MEFSETRAIFFQVQNAQAKMDRMTETAKFHFQRKEPLLFFVESEKAEKFLDELLWKMPPHSFLPHGPSDAPTQELIAITKTKVNVNAAHFAFNLCPTPLLLAGFKLIYDFEDLSSPGKKSLFALRFNAYKQAKMGLESR